LLRNVCGYDTYTNMETLTIQNYDVEISSAKVPVIVYFYADWCGPCKSMSPLMGEIASKYQGLLSIFKVNVDSGADIASRFNIMSIPALVFIDKNKDVFRQLFGSKDIADISKTIDEIMLL